MNAIGYHAAQQDLRFVTSTLQREALTKQKVCIRQISPYTDERKPRKTKNERTEKKKERDRRKTKTKGNMPRYRRGTTNEQEFELFPITKQI